MADDNYFEDLLTELKPRITTADKYRDDIVGYFKEIHDTTFPPKLEFFLIKLYHYVRNNISVKVIFKSPRGGGKSKWASAFEFFVWYALDAEAVNCGGSEEQAKIVFEYCKAYIDHDPDAREIAPEKLALAEKVTKAGLKPQPSLISVPASPKSVRGKHPGGETKTPGLLVMDEMCEMEDGIITDALGMLKGTPVPILVCLSTFHKMFGKFQEYWDSEDIGFIKFDWEAFDVCEKCTYACETCVPEFVERYCRVICKCYMDYERDPETLPKWVPFNYVKNNATGEIIKAPGDIGKVCPECGGTIDHKARFTERGWVTIKQLREDWTMYDKDKFEVDVMGWRPSGANLVIDPTSLASCIVYNLKFNRRAYVRAGVDWGARGMAAAVLVQRLEDGRCETIDAWHKEANRASDVYEILKTWRKKYGLEIIYADSSHPYQNDELRHDHGFYVVEVNFNTEKQKGVGVLRNFFEKRLLYVDHRFELMVKQLKNWRKDRNGNIKKVDDHYPDALMCAMLEEVDSTPIISAAHGDGYITDEGDDGNPFKDSESTYFDGYGLVIEGDPAYDTPLDDYYGNEF